MRLTLRTLLAYLDDVLLPPEAKEIGDKIAESPHASALIHRIREVVRKRRLTAPEISGPESGVDPNLVAEYIDSTLLPEQVADIERVFLESDLHLAEVAAVHQILTVVHSEPVEIPSSLREHMYALGPIRSKPQPPAGSRSRTQLPSPASTPTEAQPAPSAPNQDSTFRELLPDYDKKPATWTNYLVTGVIMLGLVFWIVLAAVEQGVLGRGADGENVTENGTQNGTSNAAAAGTSGTDVAQTTDTNSSGTASDADTQRAEGSTESASDPKPSPNLDPSPVPDRDVPAEAVVQNKPPVTLPIPPMTSTPSSTPNPTSVPATDPSSTPNPNPTTPSTTPQPAPQPAPSEVPTPPVPPTGTAFPILYESQTGVLLKEDLAKKQWVLVPKNSHLQTGEEYASPEPFVSEISLGKGAVQLQVLGQTAARFLGKNPSGEFGLALRRGRVILLAPEAEFPKDAQPPMISFGLQIPDSLLTVEILSPNTRIGIEITPPTPNRVNQPLPPQQFTGRLMVTTGQIRLRDAKGATLLINAQEQIGLAPAIRDHQLTLPSANPLLSRDFPGWLDLNQRYLTPSLETEAQKFERVFVLNRGVQEFLYPHVLDKTTAKQEGWSVLCLGLTRHYPSLAQALKKAEDYASRKAAYEALREWLPTAPENPVLLLDELQGIWDERDAKDVLRLVWGFDKPDFQNRTLSEQMIVWLENPDEVIRELMTQQLERGLGTNQPFGYSPAHKETQRASSIKRMRDQIAREGALIKPM